MNFNQSYFSCIITTITLGGGLRFSTMGRKGTSDDVAWLTVTKMTITKAITQASERKNGLSSQLGFVLICNAELMQMTVNAPRLSNLSVRMSTVERPKTPLRYSYHCRGYNNNYNKAKQLKLGFGYVIVILVIVSPATSSDVPFLPIVLNLKL